MEKLELVSADGTRLVGRRWQPDGGARGDLLLVHGLGEHLGRYEHVADRLTAAGWRVTGVGLRGHGESEGRRGHVDRWSRYVDDLQATAATIEGPYALLAHSMGALIALDHLREPDPRVKAAFLSAPPLGFSLEPPRWKIAASGLLSRVLPWLPLGNEIDPAQVCSDPAIVEAYRADPLVFATITPRWFTEYLAAAERVVAHSGRFELPMAVHWGADDAIVSVQALVHFCQENKGVVRGKGWPELYHEIFNEPVRDAVIDQVLAFFDEVLASEAAAS